MGWFNAEFAPGLVTFDLQQGTVVSPGEAGDEEMVHLQSTITEPEAARLRELVVRRDLRSFVPTQDLFQEQYRGETLPKIGVFVVWEDQTKVWWLPLDERLIRPAGSETPAPSAEASGENHTRALKADVPPAALEKYRALWALVAGMLATERQKDTQEVRHSAADVRQNPFVEWKWLQTAVKSALPQGLLPKSTEKPETKP